MKGNVLLYDKSQSYSNKGESLFIFDLVIGKKRNDFHLFYDFSSFSGKF